MSSQFFELTNLLTTAVAGAIGWFAGRRKQKNDFLSELQSSIDLLSEKNKRQMEEMLQLREENLMIRSEVAKLREENRALRSEIETLNRNLRNAGGLSLRTKRSGDPQSPPMISEESRISKVRFGNRKANNAAGVKRE